MSRTSRVFADITLTVLFIVVILLGMIFVISIPDGIVDAVDVDYSGGWTYDDGTSAVLTKLNRSEGVHSISQTIYSKDIKGASLCTDASNLLFDVYLGDELIYSFHPDLPSFYGKYYGNYVHFINIPQFDDEETLRIEYESLLDSDWSSFRNMRLTEPSYYFRTIVQNDLLRFMECFIVLLIGLAIVLFGFIFDRDKERFTQTISLGVVAVILSCYSNSGSLIIQVITNNSATPRIIDLMCLMLLPIPTIIYIAMFTGFLRKWFVKAVIGVSAVNTVTNFVLVRLTDKDFHDFLPVTHLIIGVGLFLCFYMIFRHISRKGLRKGTALLVISGAIIFVAGAIDMVRYYFRNSTDTAMFTRYGLMVFIIIMGYNEIRELILISEKSIKTELMAKVAYTDALTGIANREALYLYEKEIREARPGTVYQVFQLDLNYLKKANDEFGHLEGDKLIIAAARAIDGSFGVYGKCFRTGGDEFIAVVKDDAGKALKEFDLQVTRANSDEDLALNVPLSIAYGSAEFVAGTSDLAEIEAVADREMYKMKKQMKAERKD